VSPRGRCISKTSRASELARGGAQLGAFAAGARSGQREPARHAAARRARRQRARASATSRATPSAS
jgi:hypothetical protein